MVTKGCSNFRTDQLECTNQTYHAGSNPASLFITNNHLKEF